MNFKKPIMIGESVGYEILGMVVVDVHKITEIPTEKLKKIYDGELVFQKIIHDVVNSGIFSFIGDQCISPMKFWSKEDFEAKLPKDNYILCREKKNGALTGWLKLKIKGVSNV